MARRRPNVKGSKSEEDGGKDASAPPSASNKGSKGTPGHTKPSKVSKAAKGAEKSPVLLKDETKSKRWTSWWRRFWTTLAMIGGYFVICFFGQQPAMVVLVLVVQANIYRELVLIAIRNHESQESKMPGFKFFYYYWFSVMVFFNYGRALAPHIREHNIAWMDAVLDKHALISFTLYTIGFVAFVMSLRKGCLGYQFRQYAYCHMALLVVVMQSTFLASNPFNGLIWFVLPCGMVVCNDCFAYIFGFFFGKTPLIALSPKKTWEGFMGGFLMTPIWAFWFCRWMQMFPLMVCPKQGFSLLTPDCELYTGIYAFHPMTYYFGDNIPSWFASMEASTMQWHCVAMAVFASLVAPFGGFFASGFKRAFEIKDFGDTIPGHGGFTDRMDCQIIMGFFSHVYYTYVLRGGALWTSHELLAQVLLLPPQEQIQLYNKLGGVLKDAVNTLA